MIPVVGGRQHLRAKLISPLLEGVLCFLVVSGVAALLVVMRIHPAGGVWDLVLSLPQR